MTRNPHAVADAPRSTEPATGRFLGLIADRLAETEEVFRRHLASDVPFIHSAGEYLSAGGGKRVRPALMLLSAKLLGRKGPEPVTYAAVIELIHTATLIHDDIIDHASVRRGRAAVHRLWGNGRTVLLGDWLYTTAMQMALEHGNLEIIRRLCDGTLRMTEGELLAMERLGAVDVSVDEYFDVIGRKTAQLFQAAASIPALIEPVMKEAVEPLERYGRSLGVCFQLVDDLLDFTSHQSELGKPVLSDLREGRLTLPLILALPKATAAERQRVEMVLEDRAFERVTAEEILEFARSYDTLAEVERMAEQAAEDARAQLACLPAGEAREALEYAPEFVLKRRF